jgi:uncharacterized membrane protein (UPF0127 family)
MTRRGFVGLSVATFFLLVTGCGGGGGTTNGRQFPLSTLGRSTVQVNGTSTTVPVYVMDTPDKRGEGMMFLASSDIADNEGMLFVYPSERPQSFYMKNTAIPLDIAFIASDGTVLNTAAMQPFDLTAIPAAAPAQYALEVKQGTLARLGITGGTVLSIPAELAPASREMPTPNK